ncbi:MAG TPA: HD domain-containing protein [Nevskia sp.]|nr:HD domain-containing protein [Nevskia sp.]
MLLTRIELLDELLERHREALGADFTAYRNHCCRVVNFCAALAPGAAEALRKAAIAAAFHDLGIWTDRTFDYLPPSERLAEAYLRGAGLAEWSAEVTAMIGQHHKLTAYRREPAALVEAFRKADLVDVSMGLVRHGLPKAFVREVLAAFPNAGFHKRLVQLFGQRLRTKPWSPMPMMRW